MNCPECGHPNLDEASSCARCGEMLDDSARMSLRPAPPAADSGTEFAPASEYTSGSSERPTILQSSGVESALDSPTGVGGRAAVTPRPFQASSDSSALPTYESFGNRFEILELLGEGGMGRVYKAWDRELEKVIALKTIRGDTASNPELLKRFKQELLLSRKITHKNVIRIHDLGEAEGVRFFTMEYVHGESLKERVQKRGKLPPNEAVPVIKQMLGALAEAHSQGVVHRDLKPQNVMIDTEGVPRIMDFGIARSVRDTGGMTATGTVMGTPDYMSPEQAKGERADEQSDLFSFGVIMYEILTGDLPFKGDTMVSRVMARLNQKPRALREVDAQIPKYLENIVLKCLEADKALRYKTAQSLLEDLERETVDRSMTLRVQRAVVRRKGSVAAVAALVVAVAAAVYFAARGGAPGVAPEGPVTTLAIVPFSNASGDSSLDWLSTSVAEILTTEVGQSARLRTVSSDRIHQILADLRIPPGTKLDQSTLMRLAEFSNAGTILWGQYLKFGDQIRIDATLHDVQKQRTIPLKAEAPSQNELLTAITALAQGVQENLGLSGDIIEELQATAFRPSSESIQALRFYNEGVALARQDNDLEALKRFEESTELDPNFALAFARLGQTYANLGYDDEASEALRKAVSLGSALPSRERYVILATNARVQKDYQEAIESYETLAKAWPTDPEVSFNLGSLYEDTADFEKARSYYQQVLERDPNYIAALFAMGRVEIKSGNAQRSFDPLNQGLTLAIRLGNEQARGALLNAIGVAYRFLNNSEEALRNYEEALRIRRQIGDRRGVAATLAELGTVYESMGQFEESLARYEEALEIGREIGDQAGIGQALIKLGYLRQRQGDYERALALFNESLRVQRDLGDENAEALCLNNVGNVYLDQGRYGEARTYFELALRIREKTAVPVELAETLHNLGEVSSRAGEYNQALDYYLRALELSRSGSDQLGVAIESYSLGTIFGYQGRYGAALRATEEATKVLRELEDRGFWMAEVLTAHGNALNQMGHFDDAEKTLQEALALARELQLPAPISRGLNFQGHGFFYRNDLASARKAYEEGLGVAAKSGDREWITRSRVQLAKVAVREGKATSAVKTLDSLRDELENLGLRDLSTESYLYLGEAYLASGDASKAVSALETALRTSERAGLQVLLAQSHHALGRAQQELGSDAEASRHFEDAARILEEVRKEAQDDSLLERADLKLLLSSEATRAPSSP